MRGWIIWILAIAAVTGSAPAGATMDYCAHNATELQSYLTAAQTDGDDDIIHIVSGNIALTAALTFVSTEAHIIALVGGYDDAQCAGDPISGAGTTLDGQGSVRPLYIGNPNGGVIVELLTFSNGLSPSGSAGGGLLIGSSKAASVLHNTFVGNHAAGSGANGGGLRVTSSGEVTVYNNLLYLNRGSEVGGAFLQAGADSYVYNNTIVGNITDNVNDPGGLLLTGANFTVANNIVWDNAAAGGSDFGALTTTTRQTNDIGVIMPGSVSGTVTGELAVDPQFEACAGVLCFDFELARASPLVDAGTNSPPGAPMTYDRAGKDRYIGAQIDIGAFENDRIFRNGFEKP